MKIFAPVAAVVLVAGLAGCSSNHKAATSSPTPATAQPTSAAPTTTATTGTTAGTVHDLRALPGNRWSVGTLTLKVGDSVKVTDADPDIPHNFVVSGVGRSDTLNSGDTFSLTFPKAGVFDFVCTFHQDQGMEGTIRVS